MWFFYFRHLRGSQVVSAQPLSRHPLVEPSTDMAWVDRKWDQQNTVILSIFILCYPVSMHVLPHSQSSFRSILMRSSCNSSIPWLLSACQHCPVCGDSMLQYADQLASSPSSQDVASLWHRSTISSAQCFPKKFNRLAHAIPKRKQKHIKDFASGMHLDREKSVCQKLEAAWGIPFCLGPRAAKWLLNYVSLVPDASRRKTRPKISKYE